MGAALRRETMIVGAGLAAAVVLLFAGWPSVSQAQTLPTVSVSGAGALENDSNIRFEVSLSEVHTDDVTVTYSTADIAADSVVLLGGIDQALAGDDYVAASGATVTIPAGDQSVYIHVEIIEDLVKESLEAFHVVIDSAVGAVVDSTPVVGYIVDTTPDPMVSISPSIDASESSPTVSFDLILLPEGITSLSDLEVTLKSFNDESQDPEKRAISTGFLRDYVPLVDEVVTIPAGETRAEFVVDVGIQDDAVDEFDEVFLLGITEVSDGVAFSADKGAVTIIDNDMEPLLRIEDVRVEEDAGQAMLTVSLWDPDDSSMMATSAKTVSVGYSTQEVSGTGTATAADDFTEVGAGASVDIAAGDSTAMISVTINDNDAVCERLEVFEVRLASPENATIDDGAATVTIRDTADCPPSVSLRPVRQTIGEDDGTVTLTVSLSKAASGPVTVELEASDGSAKVDEDYQQLTTTSLTIAPSDLSGTIDVTIKDDGRVEAHNEEFSVGIVSVSSGAELGQDTVATVTIEDDDAVNLNWTHSNAPSFEGGVCASTGIKLVFPTALDSGVSFALDVQYMTVDGTATAGQDYEMQSGELTIEPEEWGTPVTEEAFEFCAIDDNVREPLRETFSICLEPSGDTRVRITTSCAIISITDDDEDARVVSLEPSALTMVEGSSGQVTIQLSGPDHRDITVHLASSDGTASAGAGDYTPVDQQIEIPAGETSATLILDALQDDEDESDETYSVEIERVSDGRDISADPTVIDPDRNMSVVTIAKIRTAPRPTPTGPLQPEEPEPEETPEPEPEAPEPETPEPEPEETPEPEPVVFSDVADNAWYAPYVAHIARLGITTGYPDGTYRPLQNVTRAEMAAFLVRALGSAPVEAPTGRFDDVATDAWYAGYVERIAELGITVGCNQPDGTLYCPDALVVRSHMALFLQRAFNLPQGEGPSFTDVPADHSAYDAIEAIKAAAITTGYPDGTYRPLQNVTRAEMAAFLSRAVSYFENS